MISLNLQNYVKEKSLLALKILALTACIWGGWRLQAASDRLIVSNRQIFWEQDRIKLHNEVILGMLNDFKKQGKADADFQRLLEEHKLEQLIALAKTVQ